MSEPTIVMQSAFSSKVELRSVTIDWPAISTACSQSPCSST
jgi:hypothetical protein